MTKPSLDSFWEDPYTPVKEFPTLNPSSSGQLQSASKQTSFGDKALQTGKKIAGTLAKPFVNIAASPVQLLAKKLGQPDPFSSFAEESGLPNTTPTAIDKPLTKLGSAGEVASYAFPFARFAQLGKLGGIAGGAIGGLGVDVSAGLQEEQSIQESIKPGLGTALGAGIPLVGPAKNLVGKLVGETLGVSTGTGFGVIKQAFDASRQGGPALEAFTKGLRGKIQPDAIVQEAKGALDDIIRNRREDYQTRLQELTQDKKLLDVSPVIKELQSQLKKFGVKTEGRVLNFDQSAIRFDKKSQDTIQTIFEELRLFGTRPGDRSVIGVDSLKRALGDLYSDSSNVRAFVNGIKSKTSDVLKQVEGYDKLVRDYSEKSSLIEELQRGLSLGDQAMIDTTYKKLLSSLRLNNEQRREMVEALDSVSSGELLSKIAGQQMSEFLPRGIMRPLGLAVSGGAAFTGTLIPLLKFAAFASPRLVGESLRTLGFADEQINKIIQSIGGIETLQRGVNPAVQMNRAGQQQVQSQKATQRGEASQKAPLESFQL